MSRAAVALALLGIVSLAFMLDTRNASFPAEYHGDEPLKVSQLRSGTQNFLHPILMLQSVRATLAVAPLETGADDQAIAERGRRVSAIYATASVVLAFGLFARMGGRAMALAATLLFALAPIRVVHAHYLKEDTFLTATLMASLLAFLCFLERRDRVSLVLWGAATGLACASKYFGASVVLVFALTPLVVDVGDRRAFFRDGLRALGIALLVFALVNFPAVTDPLALLGGAGREGKHALMGHSLRLFPWTHWLAFHFTRTLVPGMGVGVAVVAVVGMLLAIGRWRSSLSSGERVLLLYAVVLYLLLEISPTKSHPAFIRYGLPLAPAFAWFSVRAMRSAAEALPRGGAVAFVVAIGLLVAEPAWNSVCLVEHLERDTRTLARERIDALRPAVMSEAYTGVERDFKYAGDQDLGVLRASGVRYLVLSSFSYGRFEVGEALWWQPQRVYDLAARYRALFTCRYEEIRPAHRTFAFSNPTLRIVDLASCPESVLTLLR